VVGRLGSARVSRAGFGVAPQHAFLTFRSHRRLEFTNKVCEREARALPRTRERAQAV
jgi:hypothetical protein